MNEQLVKRIKSLLWSSAMMSLAVFVDSLSAGIVGLDIPDWLTVMLGLVFAQLSKYINNKVQEGEI